MPFGTSTSPAAVVHATIAEYIRSVERNVDRKRKLLAWLQSGGRVTMNHAGDEMKWAVEIKLRPLQYGGHFNAITFPSYDLLENAVLPWRNCFIPEAIEKFAKLKNRGSEAIVKLYVDTVKSIMRHMKEGFCDDLYVDGNAAGNTQKIHGLESCFSVSGAASGGYIGTNNDTYAGLSTALGDLGGTWGATAWPLGTGDVDYHAWTPLVVDYTDTVWTPSTKTWPNTCVEAIRFALVKTQKFGEPIDLIILEDELYRQFLHNMDDKERIQVEKGKGKGRLANLGFTDSFVFDGAECTWEYGTPSGVGYGLSQDSLEIRSMQKGLFNAEQPDFDLATTTDRHLCDFYGNMRMNPRGLFKLAAIT